MATTTTVLPAQCKDTIAWTMTSTSAITRNDVLCTPITQTRMTTLTITSNDGILHSRPLEQRQQWQCLNIKQQSLAWRHPLEDHNTWIMVQAQHPVSQDVHAVLASPPNTFKASMSECRARHTTHESPNSSQVSTIPLIQAQLAPKPLHTSATWQKIWTSE